MQPVTDPTTLVITPDLAIPLAELDFRFSRSSGPGGQHVQRADTRVELLFDVARSPSLTENQRECVRARLAGYLDNDGVLHLFSSASRSQLANRADVIARFQALLARALRPRKRRIATRPSAAARERRLAEKRARTQIKQARRKVDRHDDS